MQRLRLANITAVLGLIVCSCLAAAAEEFPNRTVRIVVAFPAGGPTDFVARLIADKLKGHSWPTTSSSRTSRGRTARSERSMWRGARRTATSCFSPR